ncbi:MAG: hypothetical protein ACHQF2_00660 [Flavobacteriales bacterium]
MKTLTLLLFLGLNGTAFGQFTDKQITLLTKINCGLTEAWTVEEIEYDEEEEAEAEEEETEEAEEQEMVVSAKTIGQVEIPQLTFDLTHHKAVDGDTQGTVSIAVFEKQYAAKVKAFDWSTEGKSVIVETKSYIVVIVYEEDWNAFYNAAVPVLLPELKAWFKANTDNL